MPPPLDPNNAELISNSGEYSRSADDADPSDGEFAITRGVFSRKLESISHAITDDISIEDPESDDLRDADTLEDLLDGASNGSAHDEPRVDESPFDVTPLSQPDDPDQMEVDDQPDTADPGSASAVMVERFTSGRPGAPIPGRPQSDPQATFTGSQWGPFRSQLDWEVARWAKLRGGSSTAVSELLAIPGVRAYNFRNTSLSYLR
jgi:hypothetical protein